MRQPHHPLWQSEIVAPFDVTITHKVENILPFGLLCQPLCSCPLGCFQNDDLHQQGRLLHQNHFPGLGETIAFHLVKIDSATNIMILDISSMPSNLVLSSFIKVIN